MFVENYVGGGELTSEAIISDSLLPIKKINSHLVNTKFLEQNRDKFWIFGNFSGLKEEYIIFAIKNLDYSVLEYDYKYCVFRSPEKHILNSGECLCHKERRGKLVSIFYVGRCHSELTHSPVI